MSGRRHSGSGKMNWNSLTQKPNVIPNPNNTRFGFGFGPTDRTGLSAWRLLPGTQTTPWLLFCAAQWRKLSFLPRIPERKSWSVLTSTCSTGIVHMAGCTV